MNKKHFFKTLLIVGIILEFLLLYNYVSRETMNTVPPDIDSTIYLNECYNLYELIHTEQYRAAAHLLSHLSSGGVILLRTVLLFLFGVSRSSLLLLNIIMLLALQVIGVCVIGRISDSIAPKLLFVGLLMMLHTPFAWSGDLTSARFEFITMCTYGIWVIVSTYALHKEDKRSMLFSAITAGFAIFCRFFTALFIGTSVFVYYLFKILKYRRKKFVHDFLKYAAVTVASGGWYFIINIRSFMDYYLCAFYGEESSTWQIQQGIGDDIRLSISYIVFHFGNKTLVLCVALIVMFVGVLIYNKGTKSLWNASESSIAAKTFITAAIPFAIFTFMTNKQALVYSMMCVPIIWLSVLLMAMMLMNNYHERILYFCGVTVIAIGSLLFLKGVTRAHYVGVWINSTEHYAINKTVADNVWYKSSDYEYRVLFDCFTDTLCPSSVTLVAYESGYGIRNISYSLSSLNHNLTQGTFSAEDMEEALSNADAVVFSEFGYSVVLPFISNQLLQTYRQEIKAYCEANLQLAYNSNSGMKIYFKEGVK